MRSYFLIRPALLIVLCIVVCVCLTQRSGRGATGGRDDVTLFQSRIDNYIEIQKKAIASVSPISTSVADPAVIIQHEEDLAEAIRAMRPGASLGDVFVPGVREVIMAIIKKQLDGAGGSSVKATILSEGNPEVGEEKSTPVKLGVNLPYPTFAPLSTMPPSLLLALPQLPEGLEFRFVGRSLILRDTEANLIVDVIRNAF